MPKKIIFSNKDIETIGQLYMNKNRSTEDIALTFEVSPQVITRLLKEQGIKLFPRGFFNKGRVPYNKIFFSLRQEREILDMVNIKKMSSSKISKVFNCSKPTILKILQKNNVKFVRDKKDAKIPYNGLTREEFYEGISRRMKNNNPMKREEIKIKVARSLKEGFANGSIDRRLIKLDVNKIKYLYLKKEKSCKQIGELLGVSLSTISKRLKNEGINIQKIGKERNRLSNNFKINNPVHHPIHKKKWIKSLNLKPNTPEKFLIKLFNDNNLHLEYVGDGEKWFNLKYFDGERDRRKMFNPDFINEDKKAIVEFFGDYWHNNKKAIINDNLRIKTYLSMGYKVLIIWGHELIGGKYGEKKEISKILQTTEDFLNHSPADYNNYCFFYSGEISMDGAKERYSQETKIYEKICDGE